ncbi:hypothetical protein M2138_001967 [Dysgonomonadaceae bacterium PH5-43]|nr:hypothetical protein [Dysgonomonadaceae bacterium PH5-43]
MSKRIYILSLLFILFIQVIQGQSYRTESFSTRIQTLQVLHYENWEKAPIINLHSNEQIEISFDLLGVSPEYFTYRIIHCDAEWTKSQLVESEYMFGLQNNLINDYNNSFNTRMDYVNYKLKIPNDDVSLRVSGNYVVQVFTQTGSEPVLNACFSVVEPSVSVDMKLSSITDKGANSKYQAVSFDINYGNEVKSPIQDFKIYVQQNNRTDNQAKLVKPLRVQNGKAIYDHNPSLIFDAGNEYRSFEIITTLYAGMHVESLEYHAPYYHSILSPDFPRNNRSYTFDNDINGKIYIRNKDAYDSNIEADYQFVHFYIPCDQPLVDDVYILSNALHNILDDRSKMEFSYNDRGYVKTLFLKEGYYSYMYVTKKEGSELATTNIIEGDFFQTENEYRVMIYSRTIGMRYDKLVGVETLQSK